MKIFFLIKKKANLVSKIFKKVVYLCFELKSLKMKHLLQIALFLCFAITSAQVKLELTPQGFTPIEIELPKKSFDKITEVSKSWAPYYNKKGADVYDVTQNSLSIGAFNESAYYYWNLGVKYNYDIKYIMTIKAKENNKYVLIFKVNEILTDDALTKITTADFFTAEGNVKQEYDESKSSLESNVNKIVNSYIDYIAK